MSQPALLEMRDVKKRFGATEALGGVSFRVERGQVHALIGENGAGKSTLMKVLAGVHAPDAGTMSLAGEPYRPRAPHDARRRGVAMIHQELAIAPDLSVRANVLLGSDRARFGFLRPRDERSRARAALARLGAGDLDLELRAGDLPVAAQQLVEIARALASDARAIVFDEPTSSLTEQDAERLFQVIAELARQGLGVVYISHFLEEVARVADVYTVLRDGRAVAEGTMRSASIREIVAWMVGRDPGDLYPRVPHAVGEPVLELSGLSGARAPRGVDFQLRRGEILGLFGLVGAGRSELLRCIFGLDPVRAGTVRVAVAGGRAGTSPRASIRAGIGFVSEDRKGEGLALDLSIEDNLTLTRLDLYARGPLRALAIGRRRAAVRAQMAEIRCRARGPEQAIGELSGGNQQKIALARLLHQEADVLLLDEPTRGIDVGTKAEIYERIGRLAAAGKSILLVSSYLPELLGLSDRIGVLCRGRLAGLREAQDWTEAEIMHCATGASAAASA